jgi:hypothetical protein
MRAGASAGARSLAALLAVAAVAGDAGAGDTKASAEAEAAAEAEARTAAALEALVRAAPRCDRARQHCIGIKLHVAVEDAGPVATPDWVVRQLAAANRHFAAIDVSFQVVGAAALPASAARIEDAAERTTLARHVAGTVIDVFVTAQLDDIDKKDSVIYGVAWPAGGGKKLVILSTMAWERTLAHELGHVFGLPHSRYAISIMNKKDRKQPPLEQRTFHADEVAVMRAQLQRMLRERLVAHIAQVPVNGPISAPLKARP